MGHAHQGAFVQQVKAGVAHMGDGHLVAFDDAGGGGAAHALAAAALLGGAYHVSVGRFDGGAQPGGVCVGGRLLGDGMDGDRAGYLARGMASHAV